MDPAAVEKAIGEEEFAIERAQLEWNLEKITDDGLKNEASQKQ